MWSATPQLALFLPVMIDAPDKKVVRLLTLYRMSQKDKFIISFSIRMKCSMPVACRNRISENFLQGSFLSREGGKSCVAYDK